MDKTQLLEAVRKGINESRAGEIAQIRKIAKDPKFFTDKADAISDSHLQVIDELEKWSDEKFAEKWNQYMLDAGAGTFKFLADMLELDKAAEAKEAKPK